MNRIVKRFVACALACLPAAAASGADLLVHPLFQDNAVIQRSAATRIFGTAEPGAPVNVKLGGAQSRTAADASGRWSVELDTRRMGVKPLVLSVQSNKDVRTHENILVGQVFVASGQSNMEMTVGPCRFSKGDLHAEETAAEAAKHPRIRLLTVRQIRADKERTEFSERWIMPDRDSVLAFSAVGYYFAKDLSRALKEPVGIVHSSLGATDIEEWMSPSALEQGGFKKIGNGKDSTLFHGMIAPLKGLTLAGVIWYQGEANAFRNPDQYKSLFPAMIADWRAFFGKPDLPFLFVQLAGFGPVEEDPNANPPFAVVREAQRQTSLSVPNVWMAAIPDLGESKDIHPREKREVGRRLSLIAQKRLYRMKRAKSAEGPKVRRARRNGDAVEISFAGGRLAAKPVPEKYVAGTGMDDIPYRRKCGGELETFALRDGNGVWHWASASIVGNEVVVRARGAERPTAVRYSWQSMTLGNLCDKDGFPASPFEMEVE